MNKIQTIWNKVFNLNDPNWGRKKSPSEDAGVDENSNQSPNSSDRENKNGRSKNQNFDANATIEKVRQKLIEMLNQQMEAKNGGGKDPHSGPPDFPPHFGFVALGVFLLLLFVWLGTGFFIVQEGQQAVITQFGSYHGTAVAGFNWRFPYPIQKHEMVYVTQIRSVEVGKDSLVKATGLKDSAMLTEDENIVEIRFSVQYRLKDARAYLFETRDPTTAVVQSAESAVRDVVGKMRMDLALAEERDQIAIRVRDLMQQILDQYKVGIDVLGINFQQGGVRPPEQVQPAFDDVLRAGQERERAKNEAQAYANEIIPKAVGTASRMKEEANAYKAKIIAQSQGDANRFNSLVSEYKKAPQVTRERMYIDAMQQVYSGVTKILIDSRQNSNLLYLPLDKILKNMEHNESYTQASVNNDGTSIGGISSGATPATGSAPTNNNTVAPTEPRGAKGDARSRNNQR
ncbi:MAG: FtsH protease activity modulator HflK [Gammaproteobacteria bacterium]|nr:FtsH protease activity modulator HflK [Gammaproteobacteria bacterium]